MCSGVVWKYPSVISLDVGLVYQVVGLMSDVPGVIGLITALI